MQIRGADASGQQRQRDRDDHPGLDPLLLTPEQAAAALGVGRTKVFQLIGRGKLESVRIDGCRRVPRVALEAYVTRLREDESTH